MLLNFLFGFPRLLFAPHGDGNAGGSSGNAGDTGKQGNTGDTGKGQGVSSENKYITIEQFNELSNKLLEKISGKKPEGDIDDGKKGLKQEVEDENKKRESEAANQKSIEDAILFISKSNDFIKDNKELLPKDFEDILNIAGKKTYGSKIEHANAVRAGMIQSFFSIQENIDLLTPSQKSEVETYLKLTESAKEQNASKVYLNIFEPTFGMIQRIEKAKQVAKAKSGHATGSEVDQAYEKRMHEQSVKYYLNNGGQK
jgi:hypothetical protein